MIIGDMEADGLYETVTKIHCAVFYDLDKDVWTEFTPDNIDLLPEWLEKNVDKLSMHNGIGYDLKVIWKIYKYRYKKYFRDTLLMSRVLWPDQDRVEGCSSGPHSIEAWGIRFGVPKPVHEDWSVYSPEMLHRCREDVKIQTRLFGTIKQYEAALTSVDDRIDFEGVYDLEHQVWEVIERQSDYGWCLDLPRAFDYKDELEKMMNEIDEELIPLLPHRVVRPAEDRTISLYTKSGEMTANAKKWLGDDKRHAVGDFCKVRFEPTNPGSEKQIKDYLFSHGWKPVEWNFKKDKFKKIIRGDDGQPIKTSPKLPKSPEDWEAVAEMCDNEAIKKVAFRYVVRHRKGLVESFIDNITPEGKVHGRVITCGCNTTRMQHKIIVNIPKAEEGIFYGKQLRGLFKASPGKVLVGIDAKALEARVEAHYIYPFDPDNARELIEGDIHTRNANVFGCTRSKAKNGKYAIGYGCAAPKLAATIGCIEEEAKLILKKYWEANPGLKKLKKLLEKAFKSRKYIISIDKRPLTVRYKHALINTLFQSCGSILMKKALLILKSMLVSNTIECEFVGNFHDEFQIECWPKDADRIGQMAVKAIKQAGEFYKLNVPLDAEYKVGNTWAETH